MSGETIAVCVSIFALFCIFMPFISLMYQMTRERWRRRHPKAPPPAQIYDWYDNYGSGPKDDRNE